jgi:sirohydrochlorin ferrochelatase
MLLTIFLLLGLHAAAQRRGGHPGTGGNTSNSAPVGTGPEVTEFERTLAIQATPDQRALYDTLSQSIDTSSQRLRDFIKMTDQDSRPADYDLQVIGLRDLLEKTVDNGEIFLGSFSSQQKSRLKAASKKMTKAGAELSRLVDILEQETGHPALDREHLVRLGEDLEKSLAGLHSEQLHLGKLMGIPEGPS